MRPRDCGGAVLLDRPALTSDTWELFVCLRLLDFEKCAMAELYPSLAQCAIVAAAFKVLLFPA